MCLLTKLGCISCDRAPLVANLLTAELLLISNELFLAPADCTTFCDSSLVFLKMKETPRIQKPYLEAKV